ncbi:MAG: hypothetical protein IJC39_05875 [Firmicutes bacterium]|nr:hypothetical protein [Bacillota bacterium]
MFKGFRHKNRLIFVLETVSAICVVFTLIYVFGDFGSAEGKVIINYIFMGEASGWGNRSMLYVFAAISLVIYIGLSIVSDKPKYWNLPVKITNENKTAVYALAELMLYGIKAEILLMFLYTCVCSANAMNISAPFMGAFVVLLLLTAFVPLIRISRLK